MAQPSTTLDSQQQQPLDTQPSSHQHRRLQKDGAKTIVDAVTAYQRRNARAERTAARNQTSDSHSPRPIQSHRTPNSDSRSRQDRRTQDPQSERRDYFESEPQQQGQLVQPRSASSPLPSKKNFNRTHPGILQLPIAPPPSSSTPNLIHHSQHPNALLKRIVARVDLLSQLNLSLSPIVILSRSLPVH